MECRAPSRLDLCKSLKFYPTDEEIKIFVTENTGSESFCMEVYSEKYIIVV